MTLATGIGKLLTYKKETTWGTIPAATGPNGQSLRRVTSSLDLKKQTYQSQELRSDYQIADFRHGVRTVEGTISGELSVGTYGDFMATICRNSWQSVSTTGAQTTISSTNSSGTQTFTRSSGSFITDGFKVGEVVRASGFTSTGTDATPNNNRNFFITSLTATVMTGVFLDGGTAMVAKAAGDNVTILSAGKKTWMATTGQVNDSYSIEHWFSDIGQSEVYSGCRVSEMDIKLPASGMATLDIGFMGRDVTTSTSQYFTSPTAPTTSGVLAAVNGALFVGGVKVAAVTAMDFKLGANMTTGEVVGSNSTPDVFAGTMEVTGQMSVYFQDATIRDLFINETTASVSGVFTTGNTGTSNFIAITCPRVKVGGASKDDGQKGLTMTMPYQALLATSAETAAGYANSTIMFQDSLV